MKRIQFALALTLLLACSGQQDSPIVTGKIQLQKGLSADSVYVGLYPMFNMSRLGEPYYFQVTADSVFALTAAPGKYNFVAWAYGYEVVRQKIFIPDAQTHLKIDVTLVGQGLPAEISSVKVKGDFCHWENEQAIELQLQNGVWILPDASVLAVKDNKYQFLINNELERSDLNNPRFEVIKPWTDMENIYTGQPIVFDPVRYLQPREASTAQVSGFALNDQFVHLVTAIDTWQDSLYAQLRTIRNMPVHAAGPFYESAVQRLRQIGAQSDPMFQPLINEAILSRLHFFHPVRAAVRALPADDSTALKNFVMDSLFGDFFERNLKLLQQIQPQTYLLDGDFTDAATSLMYWSHRFPALTEKFKISPDYFYQFIIDFVKQTPNKRICSHILYQTGANLARNGQEQKAEFLIQWLKKDYPDDFYVGQGHADQVLAQLKVKIGEPAPGFAVVSLDGDSISLAKLAGKFVFIDFWGSWCGPCRGEIPHLRQLAQTIPPDSLQVLGLVSDTENAMRAYLTTDPLPYPNALAPAAVTAYGINAFPTTFLIGPDGKIVAKNLRGEGLVKLVREKMAGYSAGGK